MEDYERAYMLDWIYLHEKLIEEEYEYYEYTRRIESRYMRGRKVKKQTNGKARNWVRKALNKHKYKSYRALNEREINS